MTTTTDFIAVRLAQLCRQLQLLPSAGHWCYADEDLLRALACGIPVQRGKRGALLHRSLRFCNRFGLDWALLTLVGSFELARMLWRQRRATRSNLAPPCRYFVGFGAGSETALYQHYCARHTEPVAFIDQTSSASFAQWRSLRVAPALAALRQALGLAHQAIQELPAGLQPYRMDFMTFISMRIAAYAYARAWFAGLGNNSVASVHEVALLAADTCAFAVVSAGLPSCFLQHGLLTCCLLPAFNRVEALTADEANFYRTNLQSTEVELVTMPVLDAAMLAHKHVLVTSIYGSEPQMQQIQPLLAWAAQHEVVVTVRPHPRENPRFWTRSVAGSVKLDSGDVDFTAALQRLLPRLVVSWASTTLAQALRCGIIPVTVCDHDDDLVAVTVYPVFRRCLRWPADAALVEQLLNDDDLYSQVLLRLQTDSGDFQA